jgi:hypothetical protein
MWPFKSEKYEMQEWMRVVPVIDTGKIFYKVIAYESDGYLHYSEKCLDIFESKAEAAALMKRRKKHVD